MTSLGLRKLDKNESPVTYHTHRIGENKKSHLIGVDWIRHLPSCVWVCRGILWWHGIDIFRSSRFVHGVWHEFDENANLEENRG